MPRRWHCFTRSFRSTGLPMSRSGAKKNRVPYPQFTVTHRAFAGTLLLVERAGGPA